ncbi:MAG: class I SAM-dependent methyltransferase [Syntrophomonas sp.]
MSIILSPEFWEQTWNKFREENSYTAYNQNNQAQYWNERADQFASHTVHSPDKRITGVLDFLNQKGILQTGITVLDIGSGPGSFTIPLAKKGIDVVAIDPAERMLTILKDNLTPELAPLVTTIQALWEDIDADKNCWDKAFDLVLATMSPAINNLITLKKMIYCSRQWCYLSGFSGARQFELFDIIWNQILAKPYREHFNDIIFPFNIIYSLGYRPEITFTTSTTSRKDNITSLQQKLLSDLSSEIILTPVIIDRVHALLMEKSSQGIIEQKVTSTIGMILWKVN